MPLLEKFWLIYMVQNIRAVKQDTNDKDKVFNILQNIL